MTATQTTDQQFDEAKYDEFRDWAGIYWRGEADIVQRYFEQYRSDAGDRRMLWLQEAEQGDKGATWRAELTGDYLRIGSDITRHASMFHLMIHAQETSHQRWLSVAYRALTGEDRPFGPPGWQHPEWEYELKWMRKMGEFWTGADPAARAGVVWGAGGGSSVFYGLYAALNALPSRTRGEDTLLWVCRNIVTDEFEHSVAEGHDELEEACITDEDWERAREGFRAVQLLRFERRLWQFSIPEEEWAGIIDRYDSAAMTGPPFNGIVPLKEDEILGISPVMTGERVVFDGEGLLVPPDLADLTAAE